jgi:hypothetical protein
MQKQIIHSKNSLFLVELIFSLLFLSLSCAICLQVFAAAYTNRMEARQWNHIQELTTTAGEALEGWDGSEDSLAPVLQQVFGDYISLQENTLTICFDQNWNSCEPQDACRTLTLTTFASSGIKGGNLSICNASGEILYTREIHFPFPGRKEAS